MTLLASNHWFAKQIEVKAGKLSNMRYIQHANLNYVLKICIRKTFDNVQILPDVAEKSLE